MALEIIRFSIDAQSCAEQIETFPCSLSNRRPLRELVRIWAEEHEIDPESVGLEDDNEQVVDLNRTAQELGWRGHVRLHAVPLDEDEPEVSFVVPPPAPDPASNNAQHRTGVAGVNGVVVGPPVAKRPAAALNDGVIAGSASSKRAKTEPGRKNADPAKKKAPVAMTAPPVMRAAASKKSAGPPATVKKTNGTPDYGKFPTDHEPVQFQRPNPKKSGTAAAERYEKYMKAKTIKEALAKGAFRGDIQFDFKRGLLKKRGA
eukprot:TRINITY_DN69094_c0_g1_i1.p1 TRINITY_DN69094_c0_g1~~TRINITY_DN69094_c0_g1_i1.p1  ORF type:complete len:260 (-),score=40.43 TRINITY_DN69094_c0_g1_i1:258-1037(-)